MLTFPLRNRHCLRWSTNRLAAHLGHDWQRRNDPSSQDIAPNRILGSTWNGMRGLPTATANGELPPALRHYITGAPPNLKAGQRAPARLRHLRPELRGRGASSGCTLAAVRSPCLSSCETVPSVVAYVWKPDRKVALCGLQSREKFRSHDGDGEHVREPRSSMYVNGR